MSKMRKHQTFFENRGFENEIHSVASGFPHSSDLTPLHNLPLDAFYPIFLSSSERATNDTR
jgi:hypothetical protein